MGVNIDNWTLFMPVTNGEYQFSFTYITGPTDATNTSLELDILQTWTFFDFAEKIRDHFLATLSANVQNRVHACFIRSTTNVGAIAQRKATLIMGNYSLTMSSKATLIVQNNTVSTDQNDETTDISKNPLQCRFYKFSGNAMVTRTRQVPNATGATPIVADRFNGLIAVRAAGQSEPLYNKLPPGSMFYRTKSVNDFILAPGAFKRFSIVYKKRLFFNTLFTKNNHAMSGSPTDPQWFLPFGHSIIVGAEKLLDSRTNGLSPPTMQYQWNIDIGVKSKYSTMNYTPPILDVQTP
jgi:hypothetical protein